MKRLVIAGAVLIAAVLIAAGAGAWYMQQQLTSAITVPEGGATVLIEPGTPFARAVRNLAEQGIIEDPRWLSWYGRLTGDAARLRAGEYFIESGIDQKQLLQKLVSGDVRLYSFTIVEGWTFRELLLAMQEQPAIVSTLVAEDAAKLLDDLGAEYDHPEGLFLPETYRFPRGTKDVELLRQAHELLLEVLTDAWTARAVGLPLSTPYEALTLASIIEKETALASERPRIAGVFVRRLQQGMRLQTDPTVIYGLGDAFDGNLTRRHLRSDTPYNTYTRGGLPPTPIALPGEAAIRAAVTPADGREIYFVATGLGDGSHKFSETKAEHDAAVREYLARQRAKRSGN